MEKCICILGIETSCDETAAAVVADGRNLLSSVVASQIDIHRNYGGVVPEVASREHIKAITPVVEAALMRAGIACEDITAVAVTCGPGLVGALLVGVSFAKGLAAALARPLVPVHHIAGHIASCYLADPELEPPFLCLVVSGGHAHLVDVVDYNSYVVLGRTRDDAPGEAFDKIARVLGLGYPGGPAIDRVAAGGKTDAFALPITKFSGSLDFSFSGLKTAALNQWQKFVRRAEEQGVEWTELCPLADFAATFREAVVTALCGHLETAVEQTGRKTIAVAGGVSANQRLRGGLTDLAARKGLKFVLPPLELCTDNAAMIAAAGYYGWRDGRRATAALNAYSVLELDGGMEHDAGFVQIG